MSKPAPPLTRSRNLHRCLRRCRLGAKVKQRAGGRRAKGLSAPAGEQSTTRSAGVPNRSKSLRAIKRQDKLRRNTCLRCPFRAPSGRCLDLTPRSGRCGDYVYYVLPGGKQWRRRWVRPKDPRTAAQLQNRARLGGASHGYGARLSEVERTSCTAAGAQRQSRPRLGKSGPLTGQQYWVHQAYAQPAAAAARDAKMPA